jgi:hypothetical protein
MANTKLRRGVYRCSFCGKSNEQVQRLIAGPGGAYICNDCVTLCNEIIASALHAQSPQVEPQRRGKRRRPLAIVGVGAAFWAWWVWRQRRAEAPATEARE